MAQLTGNKVKDTYGQILKVETSGITTTRKTVESGIGESTALSLGSTSVGLQNPYATSVPSSNTLSTALFLDVDGQIKTRTLGTQAFDSVAPVTDYDTGWIEMDSFDGITGLFRHDGNPNPPKYRIVNRQVFLKGFFILPVTSLYQDQNSPAVELYNDVETTQSSTLATLNTGVTPTQDGRIILNKIFTNDGFYLDEDEHGALFLPMFRYGIDPTSTRKFMYNTFAAFKFNADLTAEIQSMHYYEQAGQVNAIPIHQSATHEVLNKFIGGSGYTFMNYDSSGQYYTHFLNNTDKRSVADSNVEIPYTFLGDGEDMNTWGGVIVPLDGISFFLSRNLSLSQIHP
jgi:hypothetical protein